METIDCTPTWEGILPLLLTAMRDGTMEGMRLAGEELRRMARLADDYNEVVRECAGYRRMHEKAEADLRIVIDALIKIDEVTGNPYELAREALGKMTCAGRAK